VQKAQTTESKGLHFTAEEDAMIVQLGVVYTGKNVRVRVMEDLKKMGEGCVQWPHTLSIQYNLHLQGENDEGADYAKEKGEAICSC
jgi:hypothetical protein